MGDKIKIRHTCLRVRDLEKSVDFYTSLLGMELMRRRESPERGETVAYVGYGDESMNHALELVQEHKPPIQYTHGNTYGHIALLVPNVDDMAEKLKNAGVEFVLEPHYVKPGNPNKIAFFKDPDGYDLELTERK